MEMSPHTRMVGAQTAAEILGLSHWTIRSWAASGKLASHKLGRRLMFERSELDQFIRESARERGKHAATSEAA